MQLIIVRVMFNVQKRPLVVAVGANGTTRLQPATPHTQQYRDSLNLGLAWFGFEMIYVSVTIPRCTGQLNLSAQSSYRFSFMTRKILIRGHYAVLRSGGRANQSKLLTSRLSYTAAQGSRSAEARSVRSYCS
mmetsp:Transcript_95990/g.205945  ORF Transcript_95990/g.205945 Transcript_95990/m.205945 type:complete len:132 (-) Transcript_95990:50-445(-)